MPGLTEIRGGFGGMPGLTEIRENFVVCQV